MFEALIAVRATPLPDTEVNVPVVPVITLPANDPFASRSTMVEAPFAVAAVVLALSIVPLDIFDALIADNPDPSAVIIPALNSPDVPRNTIVEAPLAVAAVVLALSRVPVVIDEALIAVRAEPLPEKDVPVIAPAANSPDAPRRTIVEAPLLEEAEVLALSIVPEAMLEALIADKATPLPEIERAVISPAPKPPDPSRRTIVAAPLAEAAEVRALAIVPLDMLEALIALIAEPSPLKAPEIIFAPKLPFASRRTIVLALLAVLPVVRALSKVPEVTLEALIAVRATPLPETLVNEPVVAVNTPVPLKLATSVVAPYHLK
jgi:hypothetical protein